jgi:hypothetical protein
MTACSIKLRWRSFYRTSTVRSTPNLLTAESPSDLVYMCPHRSREQK